MGMILENAMAFGVNEALKRTFPDEAKQDPTKRPDLIKPFMMVSNGFFCIVRFVYWNAICSHGCYMTHSHRLGCHYWVLFSNR